MTVHAVSDRPAGENSQAVRPSPTHFRSETVVDLQSDFGAPLMCSDDDGVWQLHGVLSREGECEDPQSTAVTRAHPDVFTDVQALRPWIEQIAGDFSRKQAA